MGTGSPARSASEVRVSRRCSSSKAPTSASARLVTEAPETEELPAIPAVFHPPEAATRCREDQPVVCTCAGTVASATTASTAATAKA